MKRLLKIGQRLGRLKIQSVVSASNGYRATALCRCGTLISRPAKTMLVLKSCGCLKREAQQNNGKNNRKHGGAGTTEYYSWTAMLHRCLNPDHPDYKDYGGRGITVCARWRKSFPNFLSDMGYKPAPGLKIDRRKNNLGYFPDNCYWATSKQQARNRRSNRLVHYQGETLSVTEWAERRSLTFRKLYDRLFKLNWPVAKALETP